MTLEQHHEDAMRQWRSHVKRLSLLVVHSKHRMTSALWERRGLIWGTHHYRFLWNLFGGALLSLFGQFCSEWRDGVACTRLLQQVPLQHLFLFWEFDHFLSGLRPASASFFYSDSTLIFHNINSCFLMGRACLHFRPPLMSFCSTVLDFALMLVFHISWGKWMCLPCLLKWNNFFHT